MDYELLYGKIVAAINGGIMNFNTCKSINDEIVKFIEEKYLKTFLKVTKMFQIIVVGYNANPRKSFQSFEEYGWNVHFSPIREKEGTDYITFEYEIATLKATFLFYMERDLETGILSDIPGDPKGYVEVRTDEMEIVKLIKRLEKSIPNNQYLTMLQFGNNKLKYNVCHQMFTNMYILRFSYPKN